MYPMILKVFTVGSNRSNCYILGCDETQEGMIIDPGFDRNAEAEMILEEVSRSNLNIKYILNTHGHTDHMAGNGIVKKATGALILIHELDAPKLRDIPDRWLKRVEFNLSNPPPADKLLHEWDIVQVGNLSYNVIHTPGHSKGSISLIGKDIIFTGDALFEGAIGITDIPGASFEELIGSIEDKLVKLPDHLKIYPGHGDTSTIGEEKRTNPYLRKDLGETPELSLRRIEEILSTMTIESVMTPIDNDKQIFKTNELVKPIKEELEDKRKDVRIMAVVDNEMKLLGTIMPTDILRARPEEKTIGTIMDKNTHSVFLDDRANMAWGTLKNHRFVPVTDRMNVIKGFVQRKIILSII